MILRRGLFTSLATVLVLTAMARAQLCNVKVVTDASPDYYDLDSLIYSATSRWATPQEKCWALFYWNHIARRQTSPMHLHGLELTDPIRQFNDYGYTMCSTVAGINCSLWHALGLKTRYWDIARHTVSEVFYESRWHIYDNSMSALYTLCDGKTVASVEDVGKPGACAASGGKTELGHVARYHCLTANGTDSFLTGADCARSLHEEAECFHPNVLKHRYYFQDWDRGHRYILNLKKGESYTRYCRALGKEPGFYVPNHGRDPEVNEYGAFRFKMRGNGVWSFCPPLTAADLPRVAHQMKDLRPLTPSGLEPSRPGQIGEVVFKIDGANPITSMNVRAACRRDTTADQNTIWISTTNGLTWRKVWENGRPGTISAALTLVNEVNGAYEVLVKFQLLAQQQTTAARLENVEIETTTTLNSKTQPRLLLGKNTVHVGLGDPNGSIVLWPDLRGHNAQPLIVEQKNMTSLPEHPGYMGVLHALKPKEEAYTVFRIDTPRDLTRLVYGGRFYNRAPKSHIDLFHSFDGGKTWIKSYSLTRTDPPWDVIHYETVTHIPAGTKSVLMKYALNSSATGPSACSIYALRMEANYRVADPAFQPLEVTFRWNEVQADRSLVQRSHTELVNQVPHCYTVNVGGSDHPVMESLRVAMKGKSTPNRYGYADGRDASGDKFVSFWQNRGRNLAKGKPYTVSIPSGDQWGAGDPKGTKLTDGIVGPPYAGGIAASYGLCWTEGQEPVITVDLGSVQRCGAFSLHLTGYPFWDALKGEVKDEIELLTSKDGTAYVSLGHFNLNLRWKDLPANLMWPDEEVMTAPVFDLVPAQPVPARFVRYRIKARRFTQVSEVEVLEQVERKPFDLRIALPKG